VRGVLRDAHHAREHAQANELADELTCISIEYQGWAAQGGRQRGPGHSSAAGVRQCRAACARLVDAGSDVSSVVPGPIEPPFVTPRPGWAGRAKTAIAPPVMGINRQPSDFECVRFAGSGIIVVVVKGPARPPVREGDTLVDRAASAVIGQQRIGTEICTLQHLRRHLPGGRGDARRAQLPARRGQVQRLRGVHPALPHGQHR
jgi:hypothetical protein